MNSFLYDNGLRHERVNVFLAEAVLFNYVSELFYRLFQNSFPIKTLI